MAHKVVLLAAALAAGLTVARGSATEGVERQRLRPADRRLQEAHHVDSEDANEDQHRTNILKFSCLTLMATSQDVQMKALAKHIVSELDAGRGIQTLSVQAIESIQAAYAETQSPETAVHNGALMTANDVAQLDHGEHDEDLGCKGQCLQFQGDMAASNQSQLSHFQSVASRRLFWGGGGRTWGGALWPNAYVPYCFASDTTATVRSMFEVAAQQIKRAVPCFTFHNVGWQSGSSTDDASIQKCASSPAVFVQSDPSQGCFAYVGMVESMPSQRLQLADPGCSGLGTVIHELLHALGMVHEHERPDRDQYVSINWNNIMQGFAFAFTKNDASYDEITYDYQSVMHYDAFAFAVDYNVPTVRRVSGGHDGLGQRIGMSSYDVTQLETMYQGANAACSGNALHGTGCANLPDDGGNDICSWVTSCHAETVNRCCACGGGVQVQCYAGAPCPDASTGRLPPGPERECIETAIDATNGCMFRNKCQGQHIDFRCEQRSCTFDAGSGDWIWSDCYGSYLTQICEDPSKCLVWEREDYAVAASAAAAPGSAPGNAAGASSGQDLKQQLEAALSNPQNLIFAGISLAASVFLCVLMNCMCNAKKQQPQQRGYTQPVGRGR